MFCLKAGAKNPEKRNYSTSRGSIMVWALLHYLGAWIDSLRE